jgi:hypothetical protein
MDDGGNFGMILCPRNFGFCPFIALCVRPFELFTYVARDIDGWYRHCKPMRSFAIRAFGSLFKILSGNGSIFEVGTNKVGHFIM